MNSSLQCPNCGETDGGTLALLSTTSPEFSASQFSDGTKKWFECSKCGGVFVRDKLLGKWALSPKTYDRFVKEGLIKDQLVGD